MNSPRLAIMFLAITFLVVGRLAGLGWAGPGLAAAAGAVGADTPAIVPCPVRMTVAAGKFNLQPTTSVIAVGEAVPEAKKLVDYLKPAVGSLRLIQSDQSRDASITLQLSETTDLPSDEGYRLKITPHEVAIRAAKPAGLFYGVQTLRQLLLAAIYAGKPVSRAAWTFPCVDITDYPRFRWRGLLLDPARHFMPKEYVKRLIEVMAVHKLNSLQLHLTDDQGWRLEIKKYPKLTEVGAWREETLIGHMRTKPWQFDGKRHGGYYSQEDIREIVGIAQRHHINIVPEIEMPGHAGAAIAAYPELSCFPEQAKAVWTRWGINPDIFNPNDRTMAFLQDVLREVIDLFPSRFLHIGGDEAKKDYWKQCPEVQKQIRELGLHNEDELQSWFIRQMDEFLTRHGRRLVGWDEILQGGLAPGATVMSWRGQEGGITAAKAGHDVVMAPTAYTYFDYYQGSPAKEPLAIGGLLPVKKVYSFEPVPPGLIAEHAHHVLGGQGQLWSEYIASPERAEYMTWPRAAALAEVLWTPAKVRNYEEFCLRLKLHLQRLDAMKVNYRPSDTAQDKKDAADPQPPR